LLKLNLNKLTYEAGGNSIMLIFKKERDDKIEEIIGNNDDN
jgi:hypothetical protein